MHPITQLKKIIMRKVQCLEMPNDDDDDDDKPFRYQ